MLSGMPAADPLLITEQLGLTAGAGSATGPDQDFGQVGSAAADLEFAISELDHHAPRYLNAQLYAQGLSSELFFLSPDVQRDVIAFIDGFRLNFAGLIPATLADRMIVNAIDGISGSVEEIIYETNQFYTWAPEALYDMLIDGDTYVITLDGDLDDDGQPGDPVQIPSSAVDTRLFYDNETGRTAEYGIRRWQIGRGDANAIRANLWYPDRTERFLKPKDGTWERYKTDDLPDIEGSDFIPFAHLRTRAPYGRSIHADAFGPQDMIVKAVMTLMASTEFTGWPQRYALRKAQDTGGLPGVPTLTAGSNGSGAKRGLRGGPGTVWNVMADAVGAFPAADLSKLIEVVSFAVKAMSQTSRIPMHYFDPLGAGSSGESRIAADQPVRDNARRQRGNAGRGLREATIHVGRYMGVELRPEVVWAPDPVISDKTWWETAIAKHDSGVPKKQILLEAGYTPDQIEEFEEENKRVAAEFGTPPVQDPSNPPVDPAGDPNKPPEDE